MRPFTSSYILLGHFDSTLFLFPTHLNKIYSSFYFMSPYFCFYFTFLHSAFESVVMAISDAGGLNAIEELQNHPNSNIYTRAVKMLEVSTYEQYSKEFITLSYFIY